MYFFFLVYVLSMSSSRLRNIIVLLIHEVKQLNERREEVFHLIYHKMCVLELKR